MKTDQHLSLEEYTHSTGFGLGLYASAGPIIFYANGTSTSNEVMRITTGGNVGIGTQSPYTPLEVVGAIQAHDSGTPPDNGYNGMLRITRPQASGQYINLVRSASYPWSIGTVYNSNTFAIGYGQTTDSNFTGSNIYLSIATGGNVGIGTTAPGYKLQVGNSGDGSVAVANAWNTFSDIRFKKDIQPIHNALQIIESLHGVTFKWKTDNQPSIGFIAQQVQQVLPQIVTTDSQGYESLDYSKITPVLVEAVKQQQTEIDQLKSIVCASNPTNQYCKQTQN